MTDIMEKVILGVLVLIVLFYMATPLVTAINAVNLSNVSGQDLGWTPGVIAIIFFIGVVIAIYYNTMRHD